MKHPKLNVSLSILILLLSSICKSQSGYQLLKTFHIKSGGGWDYLAIGPDNRLYVSHGTQVNILDKTTGDSVGVIENTTGVHGIAFNKELAVIDPASNKVVATIPVGGKPETAVSNGNGLLYVNVEDKSEVVEVDI